MRKILKMNRRIQFVAVLSFIGLLISFYLSYSFYSSSFESSFLCGFAGTTSCEKVIQSNFSVLFGIPVTALGIIFFTILFFMTYHTHKDYSRSPYLLIWNTLGLVFIIYLISVEIILKAICIWCTAIHIIVLVTFFLSLSIYRKSKILLRKNF